MRISQMKWACFFQKQMLWFNSCLVLLGALRLKLTITLNWSLYFQVKDHAIELAKAMENEDGVTGAVKAFFKQLPQKKPESDTEPSSSKFFSLSKCFGCSWSNASWSTPHLSSISMYIPIIYVAASTRCAQLVSCYSHVIAYFRACFY